MRDVNDDTGELQLEKLACRLAQPGINCAVLSACLLSPLPLVSVLVLSNFLKMHKILSKSQVYPLENPFVSLITALS